MIKPQAKWVWVIGLQIILSFQVLSSRAQSFTFTSTTSIELPGKWGDILSAAASLTGSNDLSETVRVMGDKMRVDKGDVSTITDLEWQTITTLNHKDKTFQVLTFDELLEKIESARSQVDMADFAMEEAGVDIENSQNQEGSLVTEDDPGRGVVFDIQMEYSGQKKRIGRLPAEQAFFTLEAVANQDSNGSGSFNGTLVVLNDMWLTQDIDGYAALQAFQAKAGEMLGSALFDKGGLEKLQSTVLNDPRIDALMESVREQSQKIDGIALTTDTYLVLVPDGKSFDRDVLLKAAPKRSGLQGAFSAVKRSIGKDSSSEPESGQSTILKLTVVLKDFSSASLSEDTFTPSPEYEEIVPN